MKLKRAIATMVLVSAFAVPVTAGTFEDAVDANARGDYAKALRLIRPLANDGDAAAQFNLGLMYITGHGVQQDGAAAALWFRKAAEQGYVLAQSNLGTLYLYGRGAWRRTMPRQQPGFERLQTKATPSPSFYSGTNTQTAKG
jgi:uncharacterized protein